MGLYAFCKIVPFGFAKTGTQRIFSWKCMGLYTTSKICKLYHRPFCWFSRRNCTEFYAFSELREVGFAVKEPWDDYIAYAMYWVLLRKTKILRSKRSTRLKKRDVTTVTLSRLRWGPYGRLWKKLYFFIFLFIYHCCAISQSPSHRAAR